MASWIIIYGFIQAVAPKLTGRDQTPQAVKAQLVMFGGLLALIPAGIAMALTRDFPIVCVVTFGLLLFALLFAAALHKPDRSLRASRWGEPRYRVLLYG